jgi:5-(carboxyamino)imidazole ribonucleotide synthase
MKHNSNNPVIGILGGGQLGRMFIRQALDLDVTVHSLDPNPNAPCAAIAHKFVCGDFTDYDSVLQFGNDATLITIEIENVNTDALRALREKGKQIHPSPEIIETVQDKGLQKEFFSKIGVPTAPYTLIEGKKALQNGKTTFPVVQKLRREGYDGRGVKVLDGPDDAKDGFDAPSVLEKKVDIQKELAIQVSRNKKGEIALFPPVGMIFHPGANMLDYLYAPAGISSGLHRQMQEIAVALAEAFELTGILAIEFFQDKEDKLWVNELAPRPHNSGHHTLQAAYTSQYDQLLRALLNLSPGETTLHHAAVMVNLLGEPGHEGPVVYEGLSKVLKIPRVYLNFYGKRQTRPFRKMGHATILGENVEEAIQKAEWVKKQLKVLSS